MRLPGGIKTAIAGGTCITRRQDHTPEPRPTPLPPCAKTKAIRAGSKKHRISRDRPTDPRRPNQPGQKQQAAGKSRRPADRRSGGPDRHRNRAPMPAPSPPSGADRAKPPPGPAKPRPCRTAGATAPATRNPQHQQPKDRPSESRPIHHQNDQQPDHQRSRAPARTIWPTPRSPAAAPSGKARSLEGRIAQTTRRTSATGLAEGTQRSGSCFGEPPSPPCAPRTATNTNTTTEEPARQDEHNQV